MKAIVNLTNLSRSRNNFGLNYYGRGATFYFNVVSSINLEIRNINDRSILKFNVITAII